MALVTFATWRKDGEASDSSGSDHYATGVTVPGTSIPAVRFEIPDSAGRWLMFNNQNGGFFGMNAEAVTITAMVHLASAPPSGGGDTIMDFRASGPTSKLSVYATDAGTLKFISADYETFIKKDANELETPSVAGGTFWLQISAGIGSEAPLRIRLYDDTETLVYDSGDLTANLGPGNYDRIQIGRTTTFNTSPMDLYYGPLVIGTGDPYAPGFRAGRQDPVSVSDEVDHNWSVEDIKDFSDDDLGTVAGTITEDDLLLLDLQTRAQAGINAASVIGIRAFTRMDTASGLCDAALSIWRDQYTAGPDPFVVTANSNEAFSFVTDVSPAKSAVDPVDLDEIRLGVTLVTPGASALEVAEACLLSLYYPEAEDEEPPAGGGAAHRVRDRFGGRINMRPMSVR